MEIKSYASFNNTNITILTNALIQEYDMQDAGFNIIKKNELLPRDTIHQLEQLPKNIRNIQIGTLMKEQYQLSTEMTELFKFYNEKFIQDNKLEAEDILRITKDSIMTVNKTCTKQLIDGIFFNRKQTFNFYMNLNDVLVFFNILTGEVMIKNIGDSHTKHEKYKELFKRIFTYLNKGMKDELFNFLDGVRKQYLEKTLPIEYYREFNSDSLYKVNGENFSYEECPPELFDKINIDYNYVNLFVPLFKVLF